MKKFHTVLGIYSLILTSITIFLEFQNGFDPFLLILFPLPLYFILITLRHLRDLSGQDFTIEGFTDIPNRLDLRFLVAQTSPTFLVTICLFSFAVSGTIIRAFVLR